MGGKSYFCDYCCCYLKNDINVRKVHNSGLTHKIAKVTYMRRFEASKKRDVLINLFNNRNLGRIKVLPIIFRIHPRIVLKEESAKIPCSRFLKGYCKFDLFCQYSHYNSRHLEELKKIVNQINKREQNLNNMRIKIDSRSKRKTSKKNSKKPRTRQLPPSLRPSNINSINAIHNYNIWGYQN